MSLEIIHNKHTVAVKVVLSWTSLVREVKRLSSKTAENSTEMLAIAWEMDAASKYLCEWHENTTYSWHFCSKVNSMYASNTSTEMRAKM